jgi:hypothetical protein
MAPFRWNGWARSRESLTMSPPLEQQGGLSFRTGATPKFTSLYLQFFFLQRNVIGSLVFFHLLDCLMSLKDFPNIQQNVYTTFYQLPYF